MENRVGFGRRLGAFVIDCVLVWVLAFLLGSSIGGLLGGAVGAATPGDATRVVAGGVIGAILGVAVAAALIGTLYFLVEGFTGWTLGKLVLGIQIGNADGTPASIDTLLARYALKNCNLILTILAALTGIALLRVLGFVGGLVICVGFFMTLSASKQAIHDMIAKTAVYPRAKLQGA